MLKGYSYAFISSGLCLSLLTRSGSIAGQNPLSLVVGDFFTGMFLMSCAIAWWMVYAPWGEQKAMRRLAFALGFAGAMFLFLTLLPQAIARFILCVILPLSTGAFLLSFSITVNSGNPDKENTPGKNASPAIRNDAQQNGSINAIDTSNRTKPNSTIGIGKCTKRSSLTIAATIALSCFAVDLAMALFPVCLFHEASPLLVSLAPTSGTPNAPIGTLTQPALLCATIVIAASAIIYTLGRKRRIPLSLLSYIGFAMTAFDYVAFPYHSSGGIPLAIAEAGRIVIALFIIATALRLVEERENDPTRLFLRVSFVAFVAMLIADVLAMAAQMQPGYDYADFQFRTLFSGIGIVALVLLLLGPLPHIDKAISPARPTSNEIENTPYESSLEGHFEQACTTFATDWGLSARESEVFTLIANGRDVPYIERELVLAKSTVKTHIKHIYEKCGVSSRQDLLDLFASYKN
ncbi:MAG: helix-turn-helix transcriptional regulator [Slackia sp.]|nr:helix-turn-helix transcriptional regulator [Slackia sp.]